MIVILVLGLAATVASDAPLDSAMRAGKYPRTTSVLVERGGRMIYERYFEGANAETLQDPRSVGKSITALAVGIAIAEGKLPSVEAPAFAYLEDLRPFANDGPMKAGITIADLLTMSSALDCSDDHPTPGNEEGMYPQRSWARWAVDLPTKADYQRDARGRGPWFYCTAGVFLLGQILQRATGQPVDRYIESKLLKPLGIERVEWRRSPSEEVMTGGMLQLRPRDLLAIGRLLLDEGRFKGRQVVPRAWIRQALTAHHRPNAAQDPKGIHDYGYLFYRRDYATGCGRQSAWYMSGNGGNHVVMLPGLDAVVVVTRTRYNTRGMHAETVELLETNLLPKIPCRRT
jgi:CubicO group peptidase (beta-lactamase class C family)